MDTLHQAPDPPLRLLVVSGQAGDLGFLLERFGEGGGRLPEHAIVANAASMRASIHAQSWDAVLYLHGTPGFTAVAALKIVQARNLDLPFIIVAGPEHEKLAVRSMRSGAHDVVSTNRLERLVPAVEREVREARHRADHRAALEMLRASEARFRALASNLPAHALPAAPRAGRQPPFLNFSSVHNVTGVISLNFRFAGGTGKGTTVKMKDVFEMGSSILKLCWQIHVPKD